MHYAPSFLDEIRSRLPVSTVAGRRVKLRRAGREFIGLSPFKAERTPSFTVNDRKGFYHCFSTGEHGDIFKFVMTTEGLSFVEAVEKLAAEAGVPLPPPNATAPGHLDRENRLRNVLEEACRFFQSMLAAKAGAEARAYLQKRGIGVSDIEKFRLGFAPNSKSDLKNRLADKGFLIEDMQDAGVLIHGDGIAVPYDRFRGRIIFPIADPKGRIIAFGGRTLAGDRQPKYLNSPETDLFHKGRTLFNLAAAKEAARAAGHIVVAEGYMDVIALARAGFANAVAPLGTALTPEQLRLLWTLAPTPTLCFDGDAAGRKAAHRAIDCALPFLEPGRSLQFAFLPEGKDPDDMVTGGDIERLRLLLASPRPLIEVLWERELEKHPIELPEQRAALDSRLHEIAGQIAHRGLRFHYLSDIRGRLRDLHRPSAKGLERPRSTAARHTRQRAQTLGGRSIERTPPTTSLLKSKIVQPHAPASAPREALILAALIVHPWLLDTFAEEIASLSMADPDCASLHRAILTVHQHEESLDSHKLREHLSRAGLAEGVSRVMTATGCGASSLFGPNTPRQLVVEGWQHILMLHDKTGAPRQLQEAESDYLENPTIENFFRLSAVVHDLRILGG
jgi:DNA primase